MIRLLLILPFLLGMDQCQETKSEPVPTIVKAEPDLQYVRDDRTNLCFARYRYVIPCGEACSNGVGYSITQVACEAIKNVQSVPVEASK